MPGITIDCLTLQVQGMSEDKARWLARLIAEGLATTSVPDGAGDVATLRVDLTANAGDSNVLAEAIVSEMLLQLKRLP